MKALPVPLKTAFAATLLFLMVSCSQLDPRPDEAISLSPLATYPTSLRLHLTSDNSNGFLTTNLGSKEMLKQTCPLQFYNDASPGRLITLTATGSSARVCYTNGTQRLGVFSSGEGSARKIAVSRGETLSFALGDDAILTGLKATSATLSVQQTTATSRFRVEFYDGGTLLGTKEYSPTGTGTGQKIFRLRLGQMPHKPFTKLVLSPVVGSFSLKGGRRDVISFVLAREYVVNVGYTYDETSSSRTDPPSWSTDCSGSTVTAPDRGSYRRTISAGATVIFPFDGSGGGAYLEGGALFDTSDGGSSTARTKSTSRSNADFLAQYLARADGVTGEISVLFEGPVTIRHTSSYCGEDTSDPPENSRSGQYQLFYFTLGTGQRTGRDQRFDGCTGSICTTGTIRDWWSWSVGTR